jgi:hypothetical protein
VAALLPQSGQPRNFNGQKLPNEPKAQKVGCENAINDYVTLMDWQKMTALAVVAGTAGAFLFRAWPRRRKFSFTQDTHCGCGSASTPGTKNSIVFHARKGQRPQVIMKMK